MQAHLHRIELHGLVPKLGRIPDSENLPHHSRHVLRAPATTLAVRVAFLELTVFGRLAIADLIFIGGVCGALLPIALTGFDRGGQLAALLVGLAHASPPLSSPAC